MTRSPIGGTRTRRALLRAGVGAVAATMLTQTPLAFKTESGEPPVVIKPDDYGVAHVHDGSISRPGR